jgi:preprotein translocase subunit SecG
MTAFRVKAILIAVLIAGLVLIYLRSPTGDRSGVAGGSQGISGAKKDAR